jgi:hypothetical protein
VRAASRQEVRAASSKQEQEGGGGRGARTTTRDAAAAAAGAGGKPVSKPHECGDPDLIRSTEARYGIRI